MSRDSLDGVMEVVTWEFLNKVISTSIRPNLVDTADLYLCGSLQEDELLFRATHYQSMSDPSEAKMVHAEGPSLWY